MSLRARGSLFALSRRVASTHLATVHGTVVHFVHDVHVPGLAGLHVVLVAGHQRIPKKEVIRSICFWSSSDGRHAP
jgi:hypothetical protein